MIEWVTGIVNLVIIYKKEIIRVIRMKNDENDFDAWWQ